MPGSAPGPEGPKDDLKRKFREALDRKRGQQAAHNDRQAGQGGGKVSGAHGPGRPEQAIVPPQEWRLSGSRGRGR